MSERLSAEIVAYQLCVLDDTVAERPHRAVSHHAVHAVTSTLPWWSSTLRLQQNLDLEASPAGHAAIVSLWPVWKVLGQRNPRSVRGRVPLRTSTEKFTAMIYRTGDGGLVSLSAALGPVVQQHGADTAGVALARAARARHWHTRCR